MATGLVVGVLSLFVLSWVAACEGGIPLFDRDRTISRESFVETMVELRFEAARTHELRLTPAQRDRILARRGVTPDELVRFAEVHGGNVPYMAEVWTEVETRLRAKAEAYQAPVPEGGGGLVDPRELVDPPLRGPGS